MRLWSNHGRKVAVLCASILLCACGKIDLTGIGGGGAGFCSGASDTTKLWVRVDARRVLRDDSVVVTATGAPSPATSIVAEGTSLRLVRDEGLTPGFLCGEPETSWLFTSVSPGWTRLRVTRNGLSATDSVLVISATAPGFILMTGGDAVPLGSSAPLTARMVDSTGLDVGGTITWTSSDTSRLTITPGGFAGVVTVRALRTGDVDVVASHGPTWNVRTIKIR